MSRRPQETQARAYALAVPSQVYDRTGRELRASAGAALQSPLQGRLASNLSAVRSAAAEDANETTVSGESVKALAVTTYSVFAGVNSGTLRLY